MKHYLYIILLFLIFFLLEGCAQKSELDILQTKKIITSCNATSANIEYKILPHDRLKIILYKDPEQLSMGMGGNGKLGEDLNPGGFLVNSKGYIKLPLVGKVKVAGLTQTQAAKKIESLYKQKLTDPAVYVEIMNKRVYVLGEVKKQGIVNIDKENINILQAIASSGGLTDYAVRNSIIIVSHRGSKMKMRKIDLTNFDNMSYNDLVLHPDDIVYIQPNKWKKFKVTSSNYLSPLEVISKAASPFVTMKYLTK